jgi:hypothetical protein
MKEEGETINTEKSRIPLQKCHLRFTTWLHEPCRKECCTRDLSLVCTVLMKNVSAGDMCK